MKVKFARQPLEKSIFLAGPTPRDEETQSWRPEAIRLLEEFGFNGTVFVPESEDWKAHDDYDDQVHWEWEGLNQCTVAVFWVPRELEKMPGFTTNVEYGLMAHSSKVILGFPPEADKITYLMAIAQRFHIQVCHSLEETLVQAIRATKRPFGGEQLNFYGGR